MVCPVYRKTYLDTSGSRNSLCAGISVKKETPVNFLTNPHEGRSTLPSADVLVYGWVRGKHVSMDLTEISSLLGLGT
ncbi:auxilin-like protein [Trifolium pratense]|uniref:Auxilin-like protein n=1 Tax=Trifolium pratense TaxID=57577 RepID=A0A2K3LPA6_TRIPR|nr:auxilin-like protein [Trifolium pratense]